MKLYEFNKFMKNLQKDFPLIKFVLNDQNQVQDPNPQTENGVQI